MITPAAMREIYALQNQASQILNQRNISRADGKRADLLLAKIKNIREIGYSSDEIRQHLANEMGREMGKAPVPLGDETPEQRMHQQIFRGFLSGKPDAEREQELRATTLLAGLVDCAATGSGALENELFGPIKSANGSARSAYAGFQCRYGRRCPRPAGLRAESGRGPRCN